MPPFLQDEERSHSACACSEEDMSEEGCQQTLQKAFWNSKCKYRGRIPHICYDETCLFPKKERERYSMAFLSCKGQPTQKQQNKPSPFQVSPPPMLPKIFSREGEVGSAA